MIKQHKMSWETKKCVNCGAEARMIFDGQKCGEEEFQYRLPVVMPLKVTNPIKQCPHDDVSFTGRCHDCRELVSFVVGDTGVKAW